MVKYQMDLSKKRILVTGAAGFIGSNIVSNLLRSDCEVIGLDNFFNSRLETIKDFLKNPNFTLIKSDIRDYHHLRKILQDVDIIFHQAALGSVPRSIEAPLSTHEVNITGTLNLLMIANDINVERFLFASSSSVYGEIETLPKIENLPLHPISPYGTSKLAAENYVYSFYKVYGLKTVSLRYFNVYGPNQIASPYSGVISIFISNVLKNQSPIIYGDGTQTRDFTYVQDVVDANILAATKANAVGQVFNIAFGTQTSVLELAQLVLKLVNKINLKIQYQPTRPGDILHSYADISHAKKLLNYSPKFTLQNGLNETIKWFQQQGINEFNNIV